MVNGKEIRSRTFLGFCPYCLMSLGGQDRFTKHIEIEKTKMECRGCGKTFKATRLKSDKKIKSRRTIWPEYAHQSVLQLYIDLLNLFEILGPSRIVELRKKLAKRGWTSGAINRIEDQAYLRSNWSSDDYVVETYERTHREYPFPLIKRGRRRRR